jgi:hypothetical protein
MFQRIKNLLELSRYTVEELREEPEAFKSSGTFTEFNESPTFRPATIINMSPDDHLKDFTNETLEQSFDDPAARN